MPTQGGGSRSYGSLPPLPTEEHWQFRMALRDRLADREEDKFLLWHECMDAALAPLQPQLKAAWKEAERRYQGRLAELGWDSEG